MKNPLSVVLILYSLLLFAQVGIGTTNPNTSSVLELNSTTQGLLMPRMTEIQKNLIASPAQGLMIFNLDSNCFQFYNGAAWSKCLGEVQSNKLDCNTLNSIGLYVVSTALTGTNKLTLNVLVNVIDTYTISTNIVNGYSFSGSGSFSSIGINTITLNGIGTPIAAQTDIFTITFVGTGSSCVKDIAVITQPTRNCLDYKNGGFNTDGIYLIDPDGSGPNPAFDCYCDMTNNGGGWTLVFNHNTTGGYWLNDAEADFFNAASPGLSTNKYSILNRIDAIKSAAAYEFRLFYPSLNKTNHWSQTFNPRSGGSLSNPVAGYVPINISMTANGFGGLENNNGNTFLDGSVNSNNYWYSIGNFASFGGGVPAENSSTDRIQLYIR